MNKQQKLLQDSITDNAVSVINMIKNGSRPNKPELIDGELVQVMAKLLNHRASVARQDGWDGWYAASECTTDHLRKLLDHHVKQGSMVNVALLASMIHVRSHGLA